MLRFLKKGINVSGAIGMAEPTAPLPIAFRDEKRLSCARTACAAPSSHLFREKPKLLDLHERILQAGVKKVVGAASAGKSLCITR